MTQQPSGRAADSSTWGSTGSAACTCWLIFIVVFGIWTPDKFLTTATLHSIASEQAIVAMLGLAVLIPLSAGVFDLSIGAMINMSAIVVSLLQVKHGWPMVPSIIAAIIVTTFIGFVNGFLVVKLQISAFIATLGSATIIGAFQVIITNQSQPLPPTSTRVEQPDPEADRRLPDRVLLPHHPGAHRLVGDGPHAAGPLHLRDRREPGGGSPVGRQGRHVGLAVVRRRPDSCAASPACSTPRRTARR